MPVSEGGLVARPVVPSAGVPPSRARRALDVAGAAAGLVLLCVPLLLLYLLVRATSRGPGIFRQVRVGQGGRPFTMYKFRSMRRDAAGLTVTARHDPRVTRVGRVLRAWSLDELPQLVNVLCGQMTLVGPRPETYELAVYYDQAHRWVFDHRPGMTGFSQVRLSDDAVLTPGREVDLTEYIRQVVPARAAVDALYLRDPSLRATLRTLVHTARHVLGLRVPALPRPVAGGPGAVLADPIPRAAEEPGSAA
ncbi:sugar transferase [Actinomadura sp. NPDC047616]|uniref:sugar transferase n=1 Tax=Actinomadura sp. NPDC047616 TaxID=3155914 RepID=UPI0033EE5CD8